MSSRPNPVAETAAILTRRAHRSFSTHLLACMASDLHRLAPAAQAIAEAECNGIRPEHAPYWMSKGLRLGKAIGKLNERLAPLGLCVRTHGDPRGYTLRLHALEGAAPLAGNTWGGDEDGYGIACRKGG